MNVFVYVLTLLAVGHVGVMALLLIYLSRAIRHLSQIAEPLQALSNQKERSDFSATAKTDATAKPQWAEQPEELVGSP